VCPVMPFRPCYPSVRPLPHAADELAVRTVLLAGTDAAAARRELDASPARFALAAAKLIGRLRLWRMVSV
jgi:hypothetical protein